MNINSIGVLLILTGVLFLIAKASGIPLGRLPGDIIVEKNGTTLMFPLTSMILLSLAWAVFRQLIAK